MNIKYRPEIDGLRAVAVLAVIFYHTEFSINEIEFFQGGFIGVDIFFVISGYLITSIILKELIIKQNFSFKYFYERRVRRLIPALIFVILLTIPLAWIYLLPGSLIEFAESVLYSLGFSSNYYFYFSELDYFDVDGLYKPLLHTWSLAVEEQFYLVFPIFLVAIFKYLKNKILTILILILLVNLFLVQFSGNLKFSFPYVEKISDFKFEAPSIYFYKFYFLNSRLWELLAGSVLAFLEIKNIKKSESFFINQFFTIIGFLLILFSIFFYSSNLYYPSFYTAIPVVGTCLIIWFCNKDVIIFKLLSTKIFVFFGLISYSLYLWHYPLFAFKKINDFYESDIYRDIGIFLILLILSVISYFFIEKPARNKNINFVNISLIIIVASSIAVISSVLIIKNNGYEERFTKLSIHKNYQPDNRKLIEEWHKFSEINREKKNFLNSKKKILIIGDSHAEDLLNVFVLNKDLFPKYDFMFKEYIFDFNNPVEFLKNKIVKSSDIIIVSYYFDKRFDMRSNNDLKKNIDLNNALKELVDNVTKSNKKIILTSNTNVYPKISDYTLIDYVLNLKKNKQHNYFGYKKLYYNKRKVHSLSNINSILKRFSYTNNITFLNKEDYLCNLINEECDYLTPDGHKIFQDGSHYSINGAKYLGSKIFEIDWLKID